MKNRKYEESQNQLANCNPSGFKDHFNSGDIGFNHHQFQCLEQKVQCLKDYELPKAVTT